jgi:hypothetical protein
MFERMRGMVLALAAPLLLMGCVFSPGKFTSSLTILADRSFTFTYQGEVIAIDLADQMAKGMGDAFKGKGEDDKDADDSETSSTALLRTASAQSDDASDDADEKGDDDDAAEKDAKFKAMAEALTKEAGYRSVEYKGDGLFVIDYQISGKLTHGFLWPFNLDAEVIFPFVMVELRGEDQVRVKAPAFGESDAPGKKPTGGNARLDGVFTLITDGEIVSQNNEAGAVAEGGRRRVSWKATPLSKDPPMAVVKIAPLAP